MPEVPEAEKAGGGLDLREPQLTTSDHFAARTARERRMIPACLIASRRVSDSVEEVQTCDSHAEQRLDSVIRTTISVAGSAQSAGLRCDGRDVMMLNVI